MNIGDLKQRQALPLELKIQKSIRTIEKFYDLYDGNVYLSKGGADSNVVAWLIQQSKYKDIESVCVASVEPPENVRHNKSLGDALLKSSMSKKDVIANYGYPLLTKEVAMSISRYMRTKHEWVRDRRLNGYIGRNGKLMKIGMIPKKYQSLVYAPFEFSEKCCDKTKKNPLKQYEKSSDKLPITGEMAVESNTRLREYLKHGCIMHDKKSIKCTPIGFWTDQDIKECIYKYNIPIPSIYGEVVLNNGVYEFTGENRTGCEICAFGMLFDTDRFDRMKENKPNQYKHMMGGGQWITKDRYRWVRFRPNGLLIWSNKYWIPNDKGYGYKYVLNYIYESLNIDKRIK